MLRKLLGSFMALALATTPGFGQVAFEQLNLKTDPLAVNAWSSSGRYLDGGFAYNQVFAFDDQVDVSSLAAARLVQVGEAFYFVSDSLDAGMELYQTKGVVGDLKRVTDIRPGPADSAIRGLMNHNGKLIFWALDGVTGAQGELLWQLYTLDANDQPIPILLSSQPGTFAGFFRIEEPCVLNDGTLIVKGFNDQLQPFVYGVDLQLGTVTPLASLPNQNPFQSSLNHRYNHVVHALPAGDRAVFFRSETPAPALYVTDGTSAGTQLIHQFQLTASEGDVFLVSKDFHEFGGALYFVGLDQAGGLAVWRTDGSANGTVFVAPLDAPGDQLVSMSNAANLGNGFVFLGRACKPVQDIFGSALPTFWYSDGTAAGTFVVPQNVNLPSKALGPFIEFGGAVYFSSNYKNGLELFRISSSGGPHIDSVEVPIPIDLDPPKSQIDQLIELNGRLYFPAYVEPGRYVLKSIGTTPGDVRIEGGLPNGSAGASIVGVASGTVAGDLFILRNENLEDAFYGLSPLMGPMPKLFDIHNETFDKGIEPFGFTKFGDKTLFFGDSTTDSLNSVYTLYALTATGQLEVLGNYKSVNPRLDVGLVGGVLRGFFQANPDASSTTVFVTDGTAAGTFDLGEQLFDPVTHLDRSYGVEGGRLFFAITKPNEGPYLATWNGASFSILSEFRFIGKYGTSMARIHDAFYFMGLSPTAGYGLVRTDGTASGTALVVSDPAFASGTSHDLRVDAVPGQVFISGKDSSKGVRVWRSDGTQSGTSLIADDAIMQGNWVYGVHGTQDHVLILGESQVFSFDPQNLVVTPGPTFKQVDVPYPASFYEDGWMYFVQNPPSPGFGQALSRTNGQVLEIPTAQGQVIHDVYGLAQNSSDAFIQAETQTYGSQMLTVGGQFNELGPLPGALPAETLLGHMPEKSVGFRAAALLDKIWYSSYSDAHGWEPTILTLPGPLVSDLGMRGFPGARLESDPPVIGQSFELRVREGLAGAPGFLLSSLPVSTPTGTLMAPGSSLWLDTASVNVVAGFLGPALNLPLQLPAWPSLTGIQVHLQAFHVPPGKALAQASNGLLLKL